MSDIHAKRAKLAARFVLAGLFVQLLTTLYWTPLTFVTFAAIGAPLVVFGVFLYIRMVWRFLREKDAL